MKIFLSLLKISLNNTYGISALKYRFTKEKKKLWEPILIAIAVIYALVVMTVGASFLYGGLFFLGNKINRPELTLQIGIFASAAMIFFFGIFYLISAFYFSKDIDILLPLPLKPSYILGSKLITVMINEYLTLIPMLLPAFVVYGLFSGISWFFWIKAFIAFLFLPLIPLTLASIIVVIMMKLFNIKNSKDLFVFLGSLIAIVFAVGINFVVQSNVRKIEHAGQDFFQQLLNEKIGTIDSVLASFPPLMWASQALTLDNFAGLGYLFLFLVITAIMVLVLAFLGNGMFLGVILSGKEISRKKRNSLSFSKAEKLFKYKKPIISLFIREWKDFTRTPIYVMNGIVGMLIAPVLLFMPFIAGRGNNTEFSDIISLALKPEYSYIIAIAGIGVMLITTNLNIIASTSVSREGSMFWVSKMIPISPKEQMTAKLLHALTTELIGITAAAIVLELLFKYNPITLVAMVLLGLIGSISMTAQNLIIDVLNPKLIWNNPQEAVKQNINGFFGILASMISTGIFALVAMPLIIFKTDLVLSFIIIGVVMIIVAIPSVLLLFKASEWKYKRIEV